MNLLARDLICAAREYGARPAILTLDGEIITYAQLHDRARRLAFAFKHTYGLDKGDRIAIAMSNHTAYMEILYGAWFAGLIVAPMNPRLHPREYVQLADDCGARLCFATPDLADGLREVWSLDASLIVTGSEDFAMLGTFGCLDEPVETASESVAWLFYTSGTTGRSKGAMLTHRNLEVMIDAFIADSGAAQDDALLHIAPLSHGGGLFGLVYVRQALPQIVLPTSGLSASSLAQGLKLAGKASFFAVPTLVRRLLDPDFLEPALIQNIHKMFFGGAPMYVADLRDAIEHFGADRLWGAYGQGEAPCTITHIPSAELANVSRPDFEELLGSVGIPRTGVEVRIVDVHDSPMPIGGVGEVIVRGDIVMGGYWNMPEATAAALRGGWLHTGDLGRMGQTGLLTLVDRSKDMIIAGGSNIYPREIEEVLLQHPSVVEAAVVGAPDDEWGEIPVAFVVTNGPIGADALQEFLLGQLGRYKRPRRYYFREELPKSGYGKILKSELRAELTAQANHSSTNGPSPCQDL